MLPRSARRGWSVVFTPEARCVHVGGAAHGGRLFRENVRGHLRFLSHHGRPGEAERARRLLRASLLRPGQAAPRRAGAAVPRGRRVARVRRRRRAARRMSALQLQGTRRAGVPRGSVARMSDVALLARLRLRLRRRARSRGGRSPARSACAASRRRSPGRSRSSSPRSAVTFLVSASLDADARARARVRARPRFRPPSARRRPELRRSPRRARARASCSRRARCSGSSSGTSRVTSGATASSTSRGSRSSSRSTSSRSSSANEFADGGLHPGYAFPLWHGFLALVAKVSGADPADVVLHGPTVLAPLAVARRVRGGVGAVPPVVRPRRPRPRAWRSSLRARARAAPSRPSRFRRRRRASCSSRRRSRSRLEATRRPTPRAPRLGRRGVARARGRPPDVRALPLAAVRRVPRRSLALGAARRARPAGSRSPRSCSRRGSSCLAAPGGRRHGLGRARTRPSGSAAFEQYAGQLDGTADRFTVVPELFGRTGAVAVAALLVLPLAGLASRRRWAASHCTGCLALRTSLRRCGSTRAGRPWPHRTPCAARRRSAPTSTMC